MARFSPTRPGKCVHGWPDSAAPRCAGLHDSFVHRSLTLYAPSVVRLLSPSAESDGKDMSLHRSKAQSSSCCTVANMLALMSARQCNLVSLPRPQPLNAKRIPRQLSTPYNRRNSPRAPAAVSPRSTRTPLHSFTRSPSHFSALIRGAHLQICESVTRQKQQE